MNGSSQLRARILVAAAREASPARPTARMHLAAVVVIAALVDLAFFRFYMGGVHLGDAPHGVSDRPLAFVCGTVLGWSAIAAAATWFAFTRPSMLGRRPAWLALVCVLTPPVLFGWMLLWNAQYPETIVWVATRPGLKCLSYTLIMAGWPLVALAYVGRERNPQAPAAAGAARGMALGGLAGALVDLWCPITGPTHVLIGHIGPLLVLMVLGALAGHVLTGVRVRDGAAGPRRSS